MKRYLMWDDKDQRLYADPTIAGSITTKIGDVIGAGQKVIEITLSNKIKINEEEVKMTEQEMIDSLAIRKLTPKEAFRLMNMRDEDYEKCQAVGLSNSALYKICGNGLVTSCVQLIMEHLYKAIVDKNYVTTDEQAIADGYGVE